MLLDIDLNHLLQLQAAQKRVYCVRQEHTPVEQVSQHIDN